MNDVRKIIFVYSDEEYIKKVSILSPKVGERMDTFTFNECFMYSNLYKRRL